MPHEANRKIWDALSRTDPKHTKGFSRAGGFKGTAIKPIYTTLKMTEEFGPAGYGWGMGEPTFQTVAGNDGQVAVYCTVALWYAAKPDTGERIINTVWGVGGDMVVVKQSAGLRTDDEAFKKAFTDAVGNAMKHLGMSADVHMGLFDDSKYVSERRAEEAAVESGEPSATKPSKAKMRDAWGEMRDALDECKTLEALAMLWAGPTFTTEFAKMPEDWKQSLIEHKDACKAVLVNAAQIKEPAE